jgi:hypothetical protein
MYKIESAEDGGKAPKGPNFPLIVILFAVAILVILGVALLMIPDLARYIHPFKPTRNQTSSLHLHVEADGKV